MVRYCLRLVLISISCIIHDKVDLQDESMEEDITTFADFTLKSGRITQSGSIDGSSSFTSIPLRAYSSSTMTKSSRPFYILLALAALIGAVYIYTDGNFSIEQIRYELAMGIYNENTNIAAIALVAAIFFIYSYFRSRRASLIIETVGGQKFSAVVSGKQDGVENFISAVEKQYNLQFNLDTPSSNDVLTLTSESLASE